MGQIAHLRNYDQLDDCEVVALAEPQRELAKNVAQKYDIPKVYRTHEELVAEVAVDGIVAIQPYNRHKFIVPDLLEAEVPLFTEKPLAVSVETGSELVEQASHHNVSHMVGYHKRSDPAIEYAKSLLTEWQASNRFGAMRYVRISMPPGNWTANAPAPITTEERPPASETEPVPDTIPDGFEETYNHFINYYIHQVNLLRYCFDEPYTVEYVDPAETVLVVESSGGVTGTLEMAPYETTNAWDESVFIGFEQSYISVELPPPLISQQAGSVTVMRDDGDGEVITNPSLPPTAAMRAQARNFLEVIREGADPPCDSAEAVSDLSIANEYVHGLAAH